MKKYRVLQSSHVEGDQTFSKGQTLTSIHNLTELFPGKFEDLGEVQPSITASPSQTISKTAAPPRSAAVRKRPAARKRPVVMEEEDEDDDDDEEEED